MKLGQNLYLVCPVSLRRQVGTEKSSAMKRVNFALAVYTLRLFKLYCFNKGRLLGRDRTNIISPKPRTPNRILRSAAWDAFVSVAPVAGEELGFR